MYRKEPHTRKAQWFTTLLIPLVLVACARQVRTPEVGDAAPEPSVDVRGAAVYAVDPRSSHVHIYVYRGGALAQLGHNHVITSRKLSGRAWVHPQFEQSGFEIEFPVGELTVDEEAARREAGSEFASNVTDADREGTRRNMLRAEVLDVDRYPIVKLRGAVGAGAPPNVQLTASITIRDVTRQMTIPAQVLVEGDRLSARGEFDVRQTDFGIKPFSVVLGALEVQDQLHIVFSVSAARQQNAE